MKLKIWSWRNLKCQKFEVEEIWSWRNFKLKKLEVEKIWSWKNLKLKKFEVDEIWSWKIWSWRNLKLKKFEVKKFEVEEIWSWQILIWKIWSWRNLKFGSGSNPFWNVSILRPFGAIFGVGIGFKNFFGTLYNHLQHSFKGQNIFWFGPIWNFLRFLVFLGYFWGWGQFQKLFWDLPI